MTPVIPYLSIKGADRAIEFYKTAFGAEETMRLTDPGSGKIGHAELQIEGGLVMLADEWPDHGFLGPSSRGGTTVTLGVNVKDVDEFVRRAVAAGARLVKPVADQFYGERSGQLEDPFGHVWLVSTTIDHVTPEEMQRRYNEAMAKGTSG